MLNKLKNPIVIVSALGFIAMVLIFVSSYDWMSGEGDKSSTSSRIVRRPATTNVSRPIPQSEPSPAVATETVDVAVAEPEPPKEVTYEEAEAAYLERDYAKAASLFTRYTERKTGNPWGFYMLGLSSWKAGDNDAAEYAFERALELDPTHVKSHINLTRVLLETNRPDYALVQAGEALDIDPESGEALRLRGVSYHRLGKNEEAIDAYRRAISIDENDAWSMNNLGLLFIEEGRVDEALPALARAVEIREDVAVFFNNLGMALELTGRIRAAEETYAKAMAVDGGHDKAYANFIRVEEVVEVEGVESVDLAALAQEFIEEIGTWTIAATSDVVDQSVLVDAPVDSILVSDASEVREASAAADTTDIDR
jgi:tetratricopeptide (TPR) repeat protein